MNNSPHLFVRFELIDAKERYEQELYLYCYLKAIVFSLYICICSTISSNCLFSNRTLQIPLIHYTRWTLMSVGWNYPIIKLGNGDGGSINLLTLSPSTFKLLPHKIALSLHSLH